MKLNKNDKKKIIELIEAGKPLPSVYKSKLFASDDTEFIEATKNYKLVYKGKARKEDIIANTPSAPLQKVRSFNSDNAFDDDWSNMLIFGDNLLALKAIYEDQQGPNIYKTKNKIKLIYIDPPFATKQDFMKDREKAYRDKIIGAQFIEFLRKRLILLREILADNGSIYVHLDWKKGHYIKAIMDEVFGEHNFRNEIIWCYKTMQTTKTKLANKHETIFVYQKNDNPVYNILYEGYPESYMKRFKYEDESGKFMIRSSTGQGDLSLEDEAKNPNKTYRQYISDGSLPKDWWEIDMLNSNSKERLISNKYPTQKPEQLLERVIRASSLENDVVIDAFIGSGSTMAVSEKLNRRWIGIDCGRLAIYTSQKRMLILTTQIGSTKQDKRREDERTENYEDHSKNSRGLFLIYEKARNGDLNITDKFLKNLAEFIETNLAGSGEEKFSLICPEEKFKVYKLKITDTENEKAGEKVVTVGRVKFLISFIQPKEKSEKEKPLKAKEFTLYNAGIYDNSKILELDFEHYKSFVMKLFGVREYLHKIHGFNADGHIGTNPTFIWDYPNQKNLILDHEYVKTLHEVLGGKAGDKFYVVAPVISMGFMEDEIKIGNTTYVFLKVPLSVLRALIEKGEPGSLKQPVKEADVNAVIDAVGFDFISQPVVKAKYHRASPKNRDLFNAKDKDYIIEVTEFKSDTLVYDPEDFENFETFSMAMVDMNYNNDYFNLDQVFWSDETVDEDKTKAIIRIPEGDFTGKNMMIIFMDKYGNELKVVKTKKDFK